MEVDNLGEGKSENVTFGFFLYSCEKCYNKFAPTPEPVPPLVECNMIIPCKLSHFSAYFLITSL